MDTTLNGKRPRKHDPAEARQYVGFAVSRQLKEQLVAEAMSRGCSLSQQAVLILEAHYGGRQHAHARSIPASVAALVELAAGAMLEAANSIVSVNKMAGFETGDWLSDPYSFAMAVQAATRILEAAQPAGDARPTGLFATSGFPAERAQNFGRQMADGLLEILAGRHKDENTAMAWVAALRDGLGIIAERLDRQPEPDGGYFVTSTAPGKVSDYVVQAPAAPTDAAIPPAAGESAREDRR